MLTDKMRRQIRGAIAEIDMAQMAIYRKMTPAQRVAIGAEMCAVVEREQVERLLEDNPELSEDEAYRIVRGGLLKY